MSHEKARELLIDAVQDAIGMEADKAETVEWNEEQKAKLMTMMKEQGLDTAGSEAQHEEGVEPGDVEDISQETICNEQDQAGRIALGHVERAVREATVVKQRS